MKNVRALLPLVTSISMLLITNITHAQSICLGSNQCRPSQSDNHLLAFEGFFGNPDLDMSRNNSITLGRVNGQYWVACDSGTLYAVVDQETNNMVTQLNDRSHICLGAGSDYINITQDDQYASSCDFDMTGLDATDDDHPLTINGQSGSDSIFLESDGSETQYVCGHGSDDYIFAEDQSSTQSEVWIYGQYGNDHIESEYEVFRAYGGYHDDTIIDQAGVYSYLYGEAGNDCLSADAGANVFDCGAHVDEATMVNSTCENHVDQCVEIVK